MTSFEVVFVVIGIQGLILSFFLFQKQGVSFTILGLLVLLIGIDSASHLDEISSITFWINHGNLFAMGPLLYLFLRSIHLTTPISWYSIIHLGPFIFMKTGVIYIEIAQIPIANWVGMVTGYSLTLYGLGYAVLSVVYVYKTKDIIAKQSIKYLHQLTIVFLLGWVMSIFARISEGWNYDLGQLLWKITHIVSGTFIYFISWSFMRNSKLMSKPTYRYKKTVNLEERLTLLFEKEKVHLNPNLSRKDVAKMLDLSDHELSYNLNHTIKRSFNDLLNEYRVEEFKMRLANADSAKYTFLAIALDSGFGSKASFQRTFKKITGITPREYNNKLVSEN